MIAGLIQAPSTLSPWTQLRRRPARAAHVVLSLMREQGVHYRGRRTGRGATARPRMQPYKPAAGSPRRAGRRTGCGSSSAISSAAIIRPSWQVQTSFVPAVAGGRGAGGQRRTATARPRGSAGGARRHRPRHRRRPRDGGRRRLPPQHLQPRDAQPPASRIGVQTARLHCGACPRLLAGVRADAWTRSALPTIPSGDRATSSHGAGDSSRRSRCAMRSPTRTTRRRRRFSSGRHARGAAARHRCRSARSAGGAVAGARLRPGHAARSRPRPTRCSPARGEVVRPRGVINVFDANGDSTYYRRRRPPAARAADRSRSR